MSQVTQVTKRIDSEDILDNVSIYSCYYMKIAILMCFIFLSNNIYSCNYIFATEKTSYRCQDQFINNSDHDTSRDCKHWSYDNPHTFVAEFHLADQEWKRTLVGTMHCFGYMVGLLIVGPLSDRLGRKNAIVVTAVLGGVFGVARSFSPWYWFYIVLEFLEAAIGDPGSPAYILITEVVSKKYRIQFIMICSLGSIIGGLVTALVAWLVPYWRYFLRVVYTPALLFVFYKYLLCESPRWLLVKGNKEEAISTLKTIAMNNIQTNNLDKLTYENRKELKFLTIFKNTLKSTLLRKRFFVCVIWWITSTFVNYGLSINAVLLQGNKYLNYALISMLELPGVFILSYVLIRCKRKFPLMCCFITSAILCISQPFMPANTPWLSVIVYVMGKLFSWFFFHITYLYTSELFPTHTRNSMHALCSSIGRIGSMTAPQTQLLMAYWSGLPQILFGVASLIAGAVTLLVPDICDEALPDTVKQAEAIGRADNKSETETNSTVTDVSRL